MTNGDILNESEIIQEQQRAYFAQLLQFRDRLEEDPNLMLRGTDTRPIRFIDCFEFAERLLVPRYVKHFHYGSENGRFEITITYDIGALQHRAIVSNRSEIYVEQYDTEEAFQEKLQEICRYTGETLSDDD